MKTLTHVPREELAREKLNRHLQELTRQAPESLAAHATLLHQDDQGHPIRPARHHLEWIRMLEDRENYRWLVVVAPPGAAKSTFFSIIYPAWRIGATKGSIRIGIVSNTARQAYDWLGAVKKTIESERYTKVYPDVTPHPRHAWSQVQAWVTGSLDAANPTLFASGVGGPLQGKRFDEIVLDDPTTWDEARSETTMEGQRLWLKAMLLERFPPGMGPPDGKGRMVVVLTRWGPRDLVPTFAELGFQIVTMPALGYWDGKPLPDGRMDWGEEPLWPEKESKEQLLREREDDPIIFELVKQGNPFATSGDVFDPEMFQHGTPPPRIEFENIVQFVDTASGKDRRRGDYFALATVGVCKEGTEIWVLDMERDRYPAPEQERAVIREAAEWNPDLICIEDSNEGTALYQRLIASHRLPLKPVRPVKDKEFRAIPLANAYRAHRVWHPEGARWVRTFEMELTGFPRGTHDDMCDAAAGAFNETGSAGPRIRVLKRQGSSRQPVRRSRFR